MSRTAPAPWPSGTPGTSGRPGTPDPDAPEVAGAAPGRRGAAGARGGRGVAAGLGRGDGVRGGPAGRRGRGGAVGAPSRQAPARRAGPGVGRPWYHRIADWGYGTFIPSGRRRVCATSDLAFFPLYPMTVRAVNAVLPGGSVRARCWSPGRARCSPRGGCTRWPTTATAGAYRDRAGAAVGAAAALGRADDGVHRAGDDGARRLVAVRGADRALAAAGLLSALAGLTRPNGVAVAAAVLARRCSPTRGGAGGRAPAGPAGLGGGAARAARLVRLRAVGGAPRGRPARRLLRGAAPLGLGLRLRPLGAALRQAPGAAPRTRSSAYHDDGAVAARGAAARAAGRWTGCRCRCWSTPRSWW